MGQIETNLLSCVAACREAVTAMRRAGQGGRIVNITARPGIEPRHGGGMTAYAASKAAVAAFTQALAAEVIGDGYPRQCGRARYARYAGESCRHAEDRPAKWAKPEDVAATILYLASPDNRVTSGAIVPVYGRS